MFKTLSGDYQGWKLTENWGQFSLTYWGKTVGLNGFIERIELMTEDKAKSFLGAAGLGIVGGLAFGPVGAIAGLLAGGNKKEICFACYLKDGTKFMAIADSKTYQKLASISF